jgi:hypothetical protein
MWGRMMDWERKREIHRMLESYQQTDSSHLDSEKTAVIAELLMDVERLGEFGLAPEPEREVLNATSD